MSQLPFWMLYVEGGGAPTFRHDTPDGAKREAERLAVQTGKRVYVLEAVASCVKNDVTWERSPSREDDDIPF